MSVDLETNIKSLEKVVDPDKYSMYEIKEVDKVLMKINKDFQLERPFQTLHGVLYNIKAKDQ